MNYPTPASLPRKPPEVFVSLVDRGVYSRPYLDPMGFEILVAVDFAHREVASMPIRLASQRDVTLRTLWAVLDAADPDHIRRKRPREATAQSA